MRGCSAVNTDLPIERVCCGAHDSCRYIRLVCNTGVEHAHDACCGSIGSIANAQPSGSWTPSSRPMGPERQLDPRPRRSQPRPPTVKVGQYDASSNRRRQSGRLAALCVSADCRRCVDCGVIQTQSTHHRCPAMASLRSHQMLCRPLALRDVPSPLCGKRQNPQE